MLKEIVCAGFGGQGVDRVTGFRAGRVHVHLVAGGFAHETGGHLRLSAVLDAHEQH